MNYTVCITGTTRGIGLELAKQYAEAGWNVLACSRHPKAQPLQDLKSKYPKVSICELDVCNQGQIKNLADHLQGQPIDVLINSAGIYGKDEHDDDAQQNFDTVSSEAMLEVFKVNAVAPLMVSDALRTNLEKSQLKLLVTITSRVGSIGDNSSGGIYAYRPSKAALNMIMKSLAIDLKPRGIKVLLLHPGWVKTDMGGPDALIDAATSVQGMRQVIKECVETPTIDTESIFLDYTGQRLPW